MNLAATREALERFAAELPAGLHADRLRRTADATRALIDQALAQRGGSSAWADHNLAVVVAEGLAESQTQGAAQTLFAGVRRRLAESLTHDPDDLAAALALARGATNALDDKRTADDIRALASALSRPQAGPRLVTAAVELAVGAAQARGKAVKAAAQEAAAAIREAAERVSLRLPNHPGAAMDRVRLALLEARANEGEARASALSTVRGLLKDHRERFGETQAGRDVLAGVLNLEARGAAPPSDVQRDALALLQAEARTRTIGPKRATRLIRTIHRARQLDADTAAQISDLLAPHIEETDAHWFEGRALLYEAAGEPAKLLTLWEHTIEADPNNKYAARGLAERLLKNLREGLAPPFESAILDRVLSAITPPAMARWSAEDIERLLTLVTDTYGTQRAFELIRDKLLATRELKGKDFLWKRALAMAEEVGAESDALIDVARRAVKERGLTEARLALARALLARGEHLDEADAALQPLYEKRGAAAAEAQGLKQRIKGNPAFRRSRHDTLVAYENRIGIGSGKRFPLKVVFIARGYVLAEVTELPAPDFYEHKHLRTMIRGEDLPGGISPLDLKRGDVIRAPIRGQDADPSRDKDGLRVYWVADRSAIRLDLDAGAIADRWTAEEKVFGINTGRPIPLKVGWDKRKHRLFARIFKRNGNDQFRARPAVNPDRLPAGYAPERLGGKGKHMWGVVARTDDGSRANQRTYAVVSELLTSDPAAPKAAPAPKPEAPAPEPEAPAPSAEAEAPTTPPQAAPADQAPAPAQEAPAPAQEAPAPAQEAPAPTESAPAPAETAPAPAADSAPVPAADKAPSAAPPDAADKAPEATP